MQGIADDNAARGEDGPLGRRPLGVGDQYLVARLEQRLPQEIEGVDAAVCDHHLVGAADRDAVLPAQLLHEQRQEPGHAGRLEIVRPVLIDGQAHPLLHGVGRVEAHVSLVEPERAFDLVHHVADADDAGHWHRVEVLGHGYCLYPK